MSVAFIVLADQRRLCAALKILLLSRRKYFKCWVLIKLDILSALNNYNPHFCQHQCREWWWPRKKRDFQFLMKNAEVNTQLFVEKKKKDLCCGHNKGLWVWLLRHNFVKLQSQRWPGEPVLHLFHVIAVLAECCAKTLLLLQHLSYNPTLSLNPQWVGCVIY